MADIETMLDLTQAMRTEESSIDLDSFDPLARAKPDGDRRDDLDHPQNLPTTPTVSPDVEALAQQVRELNARFDSMPSLGDTDPAPSPPPKPSVPSEEEISRMFEEGNIQDGVRAQLQHFAVHNFMPALKVIADNFTKNQRALEQTAANSNKRAAADLIQRTVNSDPSLAPLKSDIYEAFRGVDPDIILQEGVVENVINQVIGRKAREGTWAGSKPTPLNVPTGGGGSESAVSPVEKEVFRLITGVANADDSIINTLKKPHAINLGRGEG